MEAWRLQRLHSALAWDVPPHAGTGRRPCVVRRGLCREQTAWKSSARDVVGRSGCRGLALHQRVHIRRTADGLCGLRRPHQRDARPRDADGRADGRAHSPSRRTQRRFLLFRRLHEQTGARRPRPGEARMGSHRRHADGPLPRAGPAHSGTGANRRVLHHHRVRAAPEFIRIPAREQVARLYAVADLDGNDGQGFPCRHMGGGAARPRRGAAGVVPGRVPRERGGDLPLRHVPDERSRHGRLPQRGCLGV